MQVMHVIASSRGGGARQALSLARGQVGHGWNVRLAMPLDGELSGEDLDSAGVGHLDPRELGITSVPALQRWLARHRIQILHCHGARAALHARLAASMVSPRPSVVYTVHGFTAPYRQWHRRGAMWLGERGLSRITDAYVAVCHDERRALLDFGFPAERVHVIPNGLDPSPFEPADRSKAREELELPAGAFVMLSNGRLDEPRDPEGLVQALADLPANGREAILLVAGEGPLREPAERLAVELGVSAKVRFLGFRRDVPRLLAAADVLVHLTRAWEGLPLAVMEAMAAARPVVATRAGGLPELVDDGVTGWLVARGDRRCLVDALAEARDHPAEASDRASAGRRRVTERFSQARMIELYRELYDGLDPPRVR